MRSNKILCFLMALYIPAIVFTSHVDHTFIVKNMTVLLLYNQKDSEIASCSMTSRVATADKCSVHDHQFDKHKY